MTCITVNVDSFLSEWSKRWEPSGIRGLFPLELRPRMISLLAGKPSPSTFPFESITLKLKPQLDSTAEQVVLTLEGRDLDEALQYGATTGLPRFVKWLEGFQAHVHGRKAATENWSIAVGSGSQDLMYKTFKVLVDDDDSVLVETPVYAGTLGFMKPSSCNLIEVPTDSQGLNAAVLQQILETWSIKHPDKKFPKVLYTIPTGSNPTGVSVTEERKIKILKLAKKYNFLIMEDDAYAFLYYGDKGKKARSYFSLEPEVNSEYGRVARFDSFSKVLSSGMRLGVLSASSAIVDAVNIVTSNTNLQCASTTQAMCSLLLEHWGFDGFLTHCGRVADFYREKRDIFQSAARRHLSDLAEWNTPVAGMFLYIQLLLAPGEPIADSFFVIREIAVEKGVLAVPGVSFMPSRTKTAYVRISFSLIDEAQADEACRRLKEVIVQVREDHAKAQRNQ